MTEIRDSQGRKIKAEMDLPEFIRVVVDESLSRHREAMAEQFAQTIEVHQATCPKRPRRRGRAGLLTAVGATLGGGIVQAIHWLAGKG